MVTYIYPNSKGKWKWQTYDIAELASGKHRVAGSMILYDSQKEAVAFANKYAPKSTIKLEHPSGKKIKYNIRNIGESTHLGRVSNSS